MGIVLSSDTVNRLLFSSSQPGMKSAKFKENVKQLRVEMTNTKEEEEDYMEDGDHQMT